VAWAGGEQVLCVRCEGACEFDGAKMVREDEVAEIKCEAAAQFSPKDDYIICRMNNLMRAV